MIKFVLSFFIGMWVGRATHVERAQQPQAFTNEEYVSSPGGSDCEEWPYCSWALPLIPPEDAGYECLMPEDRYNNDR